MALHDGGVRRSLVPRIIAEEEGNEMERVRAAAVVLALGLAGCGTPAAPLPVETTPPPRIVEIVEQTPEIQRNVRAGAFCSPEGARGTTKTGTKVHCATTPKDDQARWRGAE
jgi:hypothetical protein